jgi:hypothetical protein
VLCAVAGQRRSCRVQEIGEVVARGPPEFPHQAPWPPTSSPSPRDSVRAAHFWIRKDDSSSYRTSSSSFKCPNVDRLLPHNATHRHNQVLDRRHFRSSVRIGTPSLFALLTKASVLSYEIWRSWRCFCRINASLSRSRRPSSAFPSGLDVLPHYEYRTIYLFILIWCVAPFRVTLTFALVTLTYFHKSPVIGNDFTFTALFCELIFGFWLYATLRAQATGGRAPVHEY